MSAPTLLEQEITRLKNKANAFPEGLARYSTFYQCEVAEARLAREETLAGVKDTPANAKAVADTYQAALDAAKAKYNDAVAQVKRAEEENAAMKAAEAAA